MISTVIKKQLTKFKYLSVYLICIYLCVMLILDFELCKKSILHGIFLCCDTLIPSMFPFMFLSSFIVKIGLLNKKIKPLDKISYALFDLPFLSFIVFILSIIGGYPIGGKTIKSLYEEGSITENQAKRLILFCINPGPSFVINTIGITFFSRQKIGIIIYISVIFSNIIIAFLSRIITNKERLEESQTAKRISLSEAFVKSGAEASSAMIGVCGWVLLFSCFIGILSAGIKNQAILNFLYGFLEVTTGCEKLVSTSNIPLIAGIISWAGLSVHFQIMDCIEKTETDIKLFLAVRVIAASLSLIICHLILERYPIELSVMAQVSDTAIKFSQNSILTGIAMLTACFLFIIGDYRFNNRIKECKSIERK